MEDILLRFITLRVRKKRRYKVRKGVSVIVGGAAPIGRNRIYDISMGGLSFYYTDDGQSTNSNSKKQHVTVIPDGGPPIAHIPCRTVCESETGEVVFPNQSVKRRSVKFGPLSEEQKKQMKNLIKEFAL